MVFTRRYDVYVQISEDMWRIPLYTLHYSAVYIMGKKIRPVCFMIISVVITAILFITFCLKYNDDNEHIRIKQQHERFTSTVFVFTYHILSDCFNSHAMRKFNYMT